MKEEEKKEAQNIMQLAKEETEYYTELFDSLSLDELISMKRSNIRYFGKGKELYHQITFYLPFRVLKEYMPLIAIVGMTNAIVQLFITNKMESKP